MKPNFTTREGWLQAALVRITAGFPVRAELPESVRVSVGYPLNRGEVIEHYRGEDSDGGAIEIFVSPTLADARTICRALAKEAGLISMGRDVTGPDLNALLMRADMVAGTMPDYPHTPLRGLGVPVPAPVVPVPEPAAPPGSVGSRYLLVKCEVCGYTLRATRKWLTVKVPVCPVDAAHGTMRVRTGGGEL